MGGTEHLNMAGVEESRAEQGFWQTLISAVFSLMSPPRPLAVTERVWPPAKDD